MACESSTSPSSRRAWIEIGYTIRAFPKYQVALLAEGVDRNRLSGLSYLRWHSVALLAEGVDRNTDELAKVVLGLKVALLAEGVDRN